MSSLIFWDCGGNEYSLHISLVQRDLSRTEIIISNYQTRERSVVSCLRALAIVNPVFRFDGLRDSPAYTPG
jgi:hypothetical protein